MTIYINYKGGEIMGQGISGHNIKIANGTFYTVRSGNYHSLPLKSKPHSVMQKIDKRGNLITERYFDINGRSEYDIDYTDHGNPKSHSKVPHRHDWDWSDPAKPKRGKAK